MLDLLTYITNLCNYFNVLIILSFVFLFLAYNQLFQKKCPVFFGG